MELLPASWDTVPEILNVLMKHWPSTKTSYSMLKGYNEHRKKFPDLEIHFLTPGGIVDSYCTFVIILPKLRGSVYLESLNPDIEPFVNALSQCQNLDFQDNMKFCAVHCRLWPIVNKFIARKGLRITHDNYNFTFHISNEMAKHIEVRLPDDVFLDCLTVEHAQDINSAWPHNVGDDSLNEVTQYIALRPSVGLFKKDNRELISWCLYLDYGGPGLLQVDEKYRRRGYGEATLAAMTKLLGNLGLEPQAFVLFENKNSAGLFNKVGYTTNEEARWVHVTKLKCK